MINNLIQILAILGMILLCILGVLLVVLLLLLFCPFRYRIEVKKEDGWELEKLHLYVKVSWLLGLVRVKAEGMANPGVRAKVLFFTVFDSGKQAEKKNAKEEKKDKRKSAQSEAVGAAEVKKQADTELKQSTTTQSTTTQSTTKKGTTTKNETANNKPTNNEPIKQEHTETDKGTTDEKQASDKTAIWTRITQKLNQIREKVCYTIKSICDKIKKVTDTKNYYVELLQSQLFKETFSYVKAKIWKLLKHILPHKLKGQVVFGAGSPDTTGYLLGGICIVKGLQGYDNLYIQADFDREEPVLYGEIMCKGRIRLFNVALVGLQLFFNKNIRRVLKRLKMEEKNGR